MPKVKQDEVDTVVEMRVCKWCMTEFPKDGKKVYHTRECADAALKERTLKINRMKRTIPHNRRRCRHCVKWFRPDNLNEFFCSDPCRMSGVKKSQKKANKLRLLELKKLRAHGKRIEDQQCWDLTLNERIERNRRRKELYRKNTQVAK